MSIDIEAVKSALKEALAECPRLLLSLVDQDRDFHSVRKIEAMLSSALAELGSE